MKNTMVVADMPFLSYHVSVAESVRNAGRLIQEGGAQAVKLEGGQERVNVIKGILDAEIPVVGHIGLTHNLFTSSAGLKCRVVTWKRLKLIEDARALEKQEFS